MTAAILLQLIGKLREKYSQEFQIYGPPWL